MTTTQPPIRGIGTDTRSFALDVSLAPKEDVQEYISQSFGELGAEGQRPVPLLKASTSTGVLYLGSDSHLANTKGINAWFETYKHKKFPKHFVIWACSLGKKSNEEVRDDFRNVLIGKGFKPRAALEQIHEFVSHVESCQINAESLEDFEKFKVQRTQWDEIQGIQSQLIVYASIPPKYYEPLIRNLRSAGLTDPLTTRVVLEKPHGFDSASAASLLKTVQDSGLEAAVWYLDHFLGKFPLLNQFWSPLSSLIPQLWNNKKIKNIQIVAAEEDPVGDRPFFHDPICGGIVRDMFCHLAQIGSVSLTSQRGQKLDLSTLQLANSESISQCVVLSQCQDYLNEPGATLNTPTAMAATLLITNGDLAGVNIDFNAVKYANEKRTKLVIEFYPGADLPFLLNNMPLRYVVLEIQPRAGLTFWLQSSPGMPMYPSLVPFTFPYKEVYADPIFDNAYCYLFPAIIAGDPTFFVTPEEIKSFWGITEPILQAPLPLYSYSKGAAFGAVQAERLLWSQGRNWISL